MGADTVRLTEHSIMYGQWYACVTEHCDGWHWVAVRWPFTRIDSNRGFGSPEIATKAARDTIDTQVGGVEHWTKSAIRA